MWPLEGIRVVDLADGRGELGARELLRQSDVLVENNGAGVMERLGLAPAEIEDLVRDGVLEDPPAESAA
jgi:crotonobetainyl-CoA:carnitine CoA-transferase CaiB-like acyl-CoA transferase